MDDFLKKYDKDIRGVISCFDRILLRGTLTTCCYADGMSSFLYSKGIKIFDYPNFALTLRDKIRENTEKIALENNVDIEFIGKNNIALRISHINQGYFINRPHQS